MADGGTAGDDRIVWEVLVPRLLHPSKLTLIQALVKRGRPMSLSELTAAADLTTEHARYQCKSMVTAGVLEVVSVAPRADGEGDEPSYSFSKPPQAFPSGRPATA
jgi:predicted ArsR family transcriptional regulator